MDKTTPADNAARSVRGERSPRTARIEVLEDNDSRLILHLSPQFTPASVVAIIAVVVGAVVAAYVWSRLLVAVPDPARWFAYALCGINVLLVIGILIFLIRIRLTHFLVSLERDELVLRRVCCGANKTTDLPLDARSQATLVRVARQNGRPIHAVKIWGTTRTKKFGVGLAEGDKQWVVDAINAFLASKK